MARLIFVEDRSFRVGTLVTAANHANDDVDYTYIRGQASWQQILMLVGQLAARSAAYDSAIATFHFT